MVVEETDVIYEEIQTREFNASSEYVPKKCCIEDEEENEDQDTSRHSIYEDMNGFGEELFDTYSIQNIHCRQSSDSLLMDLHKPASRNYSSVKGHKRNTSSSSSETSNERIRLLSHSAEEIRSHPLQNYDRETIYSEIVTDTTSTEITQGRITRESANPILRQNRMSIITDQDENIASSMQNIHINGLYGRVDLFNKTKSLTKHSSLDRSDVYENHSLFSSQSSVVDNEDFYENSRPPSMVSNSLNRTHQQVNQQLTSDEIKHQQQRDLTRSTESVSSLYENIGGDRPENEEEIYERLSDSEYDEIQTRERSSSRPINIALPPRRNVSFDDPKQVAPFSTSSMTSSSMTSSPRGSICSSISSSEQTRSLSPPPPLPLSRKRQTGTSSWTDMSNFHGLNYFAANYLGKHCATKLTHDCIDTAVSYVAQRTNLLEMRPVNIEVTHELIRIGSNQSPWELLESFAIEEVINFEVVNKNVSFLGLIAGVPGQDAICYVLQTDKAREISDAIIDVFQTASKKKLSKSRSSCEVSIRPEFHRFHLLIKIGSTKVRRSFRCVNEYIKLVLEKVNPKEFRPISLEVLGSNVLITDAQSQDEIAHSTPSILSLGVYSGDKRYFGYIISEMTSTNKQRVQCHVYRAPRNSTAANIIDAISTSYQSAYSPRSPENCDINPIYQSTYSSRSEIKEQVNPIPTTPTTNPIYSRFGGDRVNGDSEFNGRNSITSISSNATSIGSLNLSIQSSPNCSPSSTLDTKRTKSHYEGHYSIIDKLNALRSPNNNRYSMNVECLSEEQKNLLIEFDEVDNEEDQEENRSQSPEDEGSTETLLTLTPSSPSSTSSLTRSSPAISKKQRPMSLQLHHSNDPFEMIQGETEEYQRLEDLKRDKEQRKSKSMKRLSKFCGSIRGRLSSQGGPVTPTEENGFQLVETPISLESPTAVENQIISATYNFKITYLCSTLVKAPLRPKHVQECYKQFLKEKKKSEKISNNCGQKTIGTPVELVLTTDTEIIMLDPSDRTNVIRQFPINIYEKCVMHPEENMGCFAFSTNIPGNQQQPGQKLHHKIHLFTMVLEMKSRIITAFDELAINRNKTASLPRANEQDGFLI
ncbi:uncharacterized protein [Clytia hemisphaerica]|uniref:PID domain-containing protein n=1 Tax=Clytia hemisphaerica TaxID=252671 RepID=A0A7M5V5N4_9CNID